MKQSLITAAIAIAAITIAIALGACTLTVSPDGTRTYGMDGAEVARAIIIYSK